MSVSTPTKDVTEKYKMIQEQVTSTRLSSANRATRSHSINTIDILCWYRIVIGQSDFLTYSQPYNTHTLLVPDRHQPTKLSYILSIKQLVPDRHRPTRLLTYPCQQDLTKSSVPKKNLKYTHPHTHTHTPISIYRPQKGLLYYDF